MKKYLITLTDPRSYSATVEAESIEEAKALALEVPEVELTPNWDNDQGLIVEDVREI